MSVTTQVITFSDIYTEILNKMKQPTNVTAITAQAKRYANTAIGDMILGFEYKLPFLERSSILTLQTPYTTGTVSISAGSTTLTGVSTVWTTTNTYGVANARVGGKILLAGTSDIYTVTAVGGAGTITLNTRYVGTTLAAGTTYTYFEDTYDLATDFLKPVNARLFSTALMIDIIGRHDFQRRFPRPRISGKPTLCTILDSGYSGSTTMVKQIQFASYPNTTLLVPYAYITSNLGVSSVGVEQASMTADTDEPILPLRYRNGIVLQAIATWYRDKKDDARAMSADADYKTLIGRLVGDLDIGSTVVAQVQPRTGMYTSYARKPYNGSSKRYSHNNSFDEFRS